MQKERARLEDSPETRPAPAARPIACALLLAWAGSLLWYGAVVPEAISAAAAALGALLGAAVFLLPSTAPASRLAVLFLAGLAGIALLQLVPGTSALFPLAAQLRELHGVSGPAPGTGDLYLTVRQLAQFAAAAAVALLVARLIHSGIPRSAVARAILAVLLLEAAYAILQTGFNIRNIPFFGPRPYPDSASGTLVNRNHFGGLMALGLPLAAALAWARSRSPSLARRRRVEAALLWTAAAGLLAVALVATRSRGAALAAAAALVVLPFLLKSRSRAGGAAAALLFTAIASAVLAASHADPLIRRFESLEEGAAAQNDRVIVWKASLAGWTRQPALGYGLGTFPRTFHHAQPPELWGQYQHAHNEYVNALYEGGPLFLALLLASVAVWAARALRGLRRLHGSERAVAAAALAAVLSAAVHALVDFDLRITSNLLLFAALLPLASPPAPDPLPAGATPSRGPALLTASLALSTAAALAFLPLNPDHTVRRAPTLDPARAEVALHAALRISPFDGRASWLQGRAAQRRGDFDAADRRFETAALLRPSHAPLQIEAALWFWEAPDPRFRATGIACLQRALAQSPGYLDEALDLYWTREDPVEPWIPALTSPAAAARFAAFLSRTGRWREAVDAFERTVPADARHSAAWDQFAYGLMEAGQWGLEAQVRERRVAVKSDTRAHLLAARAWIRLGAWDDAHRNAQIAARTDPGLRDAHLSLAEALEGRGDPLGAVEALTAALRSKPDDIPLKLRRAALFERQKMYIPAIEDYEEVVKAEAQNREGVLGLARSLLGAGRKDSARGVVSEWLLDHPGDAAFQELRTGM